MFSRQHPAFLAAAGAGGTSNPGHLLATVSGVLLEHRQVLHSRATTEGDILNPNRGI